ncbi:MAG: cobyric acid synthase, partial [Acidimicrobiales bacterium]
DVALDAEDSLALDGRSPRPTSLGAATATADTHGDGLDVAVIRFPRISNFTDLDAVAIEPGVAVRYVTGPAGLGDPDLIVMPGTKATVADLDWFRGTGLDEAVRRRQDTPVLGICGGYQMMGRVIDDEIESTRGRVPGLGWLDITTRFSPEKVTRQRRGRALGQRVSGYQIHHGAVSAEAHQPLLALDDVHGCEDEGTRAGRLLGTSLHGLLEADGFRAAFLEAVAARRGRRWQPAGVSFAAAREAQWDRLADALEGNVDMDAIERLIEVGV